MPELLRPLGYRQRDDAGLHRALTRAAAEYLRQRGDHRFADGWMLAKTLVLLGLCAGFYYLSLSSVSKIAFFGFYCAFIFTALLLAINVVHDASHNAIFKRAWANRWINYLVTLPLGLDPDCWRVRHIIFHHAYTNIQHYDLDIEENGILRQTPYQRWYPFMRWQHIYWPLVAACTFPSLIWAFDWMDRGNVTRATARLRYQGIQGWAVFLLGKVGHLVIALLIPWLVMAPQGLSFIALLAVYIVSQMFASLIFVVLILGTHWAKAKFYQPPETGLMPHGWYYHTFSTCYDWITKPDWLTYWLGGLNLHLTHHLFPDWNHRHYPALAKIIADIAPQYGMEYHSVTLEQLFTYQQRFLKAMGRGDIVE